MYNTYAIYVDVHMTFEGLTHLHNIYLKIFKCTELFLKHNHHVVMLGLGKKCIAFTGTAVRKEVAGRFRGPLGTQTLYLDRYLGKQKLPQDYGDSRHVIGLDVAFSGRRLTARRTRHFGWRVHNPSMLADQRRAHLRAVEDSTEVQGLMRTRPRNHISS